MDDQRFGAALRAARVRRGLRQRDLARLAGVSDATVSRLERGHLEGLAIGTVRAVAGKLDIGIELQPRSRSANLDRVVNANHASLGEAVIRWFGGLGDWIIPPEVSFSRFGERGVIDLLAWHPATRSLLVIELKTAIVDVGELLGTLDRKIRNGWHVAGELGWDPRTVSGLLIIAEGSTNRRRIGAHRATFDAAFPARIDRLRAWLRQPAGQVRGLVFFSDRHPGKVIQRFATRQRVSVPRKTSSSVG